MVKNKVLILPMMKLSHPRLSWSRLNLENSGQPAQMCDMRMRPLLFKSICTAWVSWGWPFCVLIHCARSDTVSSNILTRPGLGQRVMCCVVSTWVPQHLQRVLCEMSNRDKCLLVPQKPDTCFVIHTWSIFGRLVMVRSMLSQSTRWKWRTGTIFCLSRKIRAV